MNITEDFDPKGQPLESIAFGDVFVYDGSYYMRCEMKKNIEQRMTIDPELIKTHSWATNLANGEVCLVPFMIVPPIHARIRISGRAD